MIRYPSSARQTSVSRSPDISALLDRHARDRGSHTALVTSCGALDYATLRARSEHLAAGLLRAGLEPGDRVVVFVPMGEPLYLLLLALFRAGLTAVTVDPGMGWGRVRHALRLAEPAAFVGIPLAHALRMGLRSAPLRGVRLHLTDRSGVPGVPSLGDIEALGRRRGRPGASWPRPEPDTPALLTFTSGTTGTPRGAVRSHGFLLAQHNALQDALGTRPDDVAVQSLPVFLLHILAAGATAVVPRFRGAGPAPKRPAEVADLVHRLGVTTLTGSPGFYGPLIEWARRQRVQLPGVRVAYIGGAMVSSRMVARLRALLPDGEVLVVYGSTEAEPISTLAGGDILWETADSTRRGEGTCVGAPAGELRVHLDPVEGDVSEILVSGPHVSKSYYRAREDDEKAKLHTPDGVVWHRTGDCARRDERDRLWLMGRKGEQLNGPSGTLWPYAVEGVVQGVDGVAQAALVAVRDGKGAAEAVVAVQPDSWRTAPGLARRVRRRLASAGLPVDAVRLVRTMPLDRRHRSRVDRKTLAQRLGSRGEHPG